MSQEDQLQQKSFAFTWCFPLASSIGATALFLGIVTLFTGRRELVGNALPHLAIRSTDWLLFVAGVVLLLASSLILAITVHRNRAVRLAMAMVSQPAVDPRTRESTMLKPSSSKIQVAILNILLLGLGLPAFAVVTFLLKPSAHMILPTFFLFLAGIIILANAADSLSCRVQILEGEIRFWSWFRAKVFPTLEIRSAKFSGYRGTTSLTVLGDRSWFTVSSNSFEPSQLDTIRKFCDRAVDVYPDWSS